MPDVGSLVSFRICDVYLPEGKELLEKLTESNVIVGRLIEMSDCGGARNIFGVVRLREGQTVIVSVDKLGAVQSGSEPL